MSKIKIQIKSIFGKILFEHEKENNAIKDTVKKAIMQGADFRGVDFRGTDFRGADFRGVDFRGTDFRGTYFRGAYFRGAYFRGADFQGVDFRGAYFRGVDFRGAYFQGVDFRGAYFRGVDFRGAYFRGVDFQGAYFRGAENEKITVKKMRLFSGIYKYECAPFISDENIKYVKLGCFTRKLSEWEEDFWNNDSEFPNDGSKKSELRKLAFETSKKWFKIIEKNN